MGSRLREAPGSGSRAAAILAIAVLALTCASAAGASTWSVTKLRDGGALGPLFAASCPTTQFCVVGGSDTLIATSNNPTGGRSAWNAFHPGGAWDNPEGLGAGGTISFPGAQVRGLSCPSVDLCVGATLDGRILSSTNPTGGPGAWKIVPLSGEKEPRIHMTGISCPSPALCVVVAYGGKVLTAGDPTGDAPAWSVTELEAPVDFRGVSCPTVSFCAAVGNEGTIVTSTDPAGSASAWGIVGRPGGESNLNGISCPTSSLCVTGNAGQMITSTNPSGGLSSWKAVAAGTGLPVKGVSCPLLTACAAVDNNSDVIVSTDPTGPAAAWSFENVIPAPRTPEGGPNGMFAIACPSTSLCVGAGQNEQIITSRDPFATEPAQSPRGSKRLRVVITHHPAKRLDPRKGGARVTFRFRATGKVARFQCKVKGRRFRRCRSPRRYRVGSGAHVFKVRAIAPNGARTRAAAFHFSMGRLAEPQPVGSCGHSRSGPCINAR